MIASKSAIVCRNIATTAARLYTKPKHGPGSNLPFSIQNQYQFTLVFTIFSATGLGLPFVIVRHQLLKGQ